MNFNISKNEFLKKFQTNMPFLTKQAFEPDLDWDDVDRIVARSDILSQDFKLNFSGRVLDKNEYIEKYEDIGKTRYRFIRNKFYKYLQDGATVIANKISNEPEIYKYRRFIEHFSGRPTIASLYLAYGTDSSFRAHWDTRDVFVFQFEGKKKWILYEPNFELPLNHQQSKDMPDYPCPKSPSMEVILEKGDILYVPRGWWHDPIPLGEPTLHLSIGTYPFYPRDFMNWICNLLPDYKVSARRDILSHGESIENFKELSSVFNSYITNENIFKAFRAELEDKIYRTESPLNLNILAKPNLNKEIPGNALLDINIINNVDYDLNLLVINGLKVNISEESEDIIKFLLENPMVRFDSLIANFKEIDEEKLKGFIFDLCFNDVVGIYF
ncbi:JmjC domain-containing protein [Acinetobacter guillouiae]|uniref:JmjC domain-containing protein n=1 Tax=Acinetobacter guillouiae TaxID=106649 RepID=UPI002FDA8500